MRFESQEHWQAKRLAYVPGAWVARVEKRHAGKITSDLRAGNLWLLDLSEGMRRLRVPVTMTDGELIDFAARRAAEAMGLGEVSPGVFLSEPAALRARLAAYVKRYGIAEPEPIRITRKGRRAGVSDAGAIARMCCPLWWRRKLRQGQARAIEAKAIELGYVHKRAEIYASDATVARRQQQRARNAAGLEATEAINRDTGEIFNLARLAEVSVANPRIRRGELMTRIAGFEAIAKPLGHAGEFITLTAPSKYHAKRTAGPGRVEDNPKYGGATPRETQGYLARLWAKIRAKLARVGIAPYGFRIAEPHHDATPHWHMLLFVVADAVQAMRNVIRAYALKEDGDEAGAVDARVTFKAIDWSRGSAAGYVAKYVSKNIDGGGYVVQGDTEGGPGDLFPGHRVEAWASTWGIRQFQQIGGPPVGVWRELRRLEKGPEYPAEIEAARSAADCGRSGHDENGAAGNWRRYVEVMGGPVMRRDDRPIAVARSRDGERYSYVMQAPEPANATRYGETAPGVVFGLLHRPSGAVFASVRYRWEIKGGRDYVLDRENGAAGGGHASMGCRRGGKAAASQPDCPTVQGWIDGERTEGMHTPEPWMVDPDDRPGYEWNNHIVSATDPNQTICFMTHDNTAENIKGEANARRIVACVNACKGIKTESLEMEVLSWITDETGENPLQRERDELLEARRAWSPVNNCTREIPPSLSWAALRALTPVADRGNWLEGAALSAWESKGGDCGRSQRTESGAGDAGRGSKPGAMGNAPEI